jgi:hypothetical protein
MSFDSTFDYSGVVTAITNDLNTFTTKLADINTQIASLQSVPAYSSIPAVENQIATLTGQAKNYQNYVTQINALLDEIKNIQGLPDDNKATLYYFYTVLSTVGVSLSDFMSKMPFNLIALNDPIIQQLVADIVTPADVKVSIATALYNSYKVDIRMAYSVFYLPRN